MFYTVYGRYHRKLEENSLVITRKQRNYVAVMGKQTKYIYVWSFRASVKGKCKVTHAVGWEVTVFYLCWLNSCLPVKHHSEASTFQQPPQLSRHYENGGPLFEHSQSQRISGPLWMTVKVRRPPTPALQFGRAPWANNGREGGSFSSGPAAAP